MKVKAIKRFYDPFLRRHVVPNEEIEIKPEHLSGYKPYIAAKQEQAAAKDAPAKKASEPKKKRGE